MLWEGCINILTRGKGSSRVEAKMTIEGLEFEQLKDLRNLRFARAWKRLLELGVVEEVEDVSSN